MHCAGLPTSPPPSTCSIALYHSYLGVWPKWVPCLALGAHAWLVGGELGEGLGGQVALPYNF